jgi:hypothetical protein
MAWAQKHPVAGTAYALPTQLFPADNWWNLDISAAPVDANSDTIIACLGDNTLNGSFGSPDGYGIPYCTVSGDYPKVSFQGGAYWAESDDIGYPIPIPALTETGWTEKVNETLSDPITAGDRHLLIVDVDNNILYEIYQPFYNNTPLPVLWWDGSATIQPYAYYCASAAHWHMNTNETRPDGWTSADAAGLQILPGLFTYDEVTGATPIAHAARVCIQWTGNTPPYYVWPATHVAMGRRNGFYQHPMGTRFRLKASFDTSWANAYPETKKLYDCMRTYGLIFADNGTSDSRPQVIGSNDPRWGAWDSTVSSRVMWAFLYTPISAFEVIELGWTPTVYWLTTLGDSKTESAPWATTLLATLQVSYGTAWQSSSYAAGSTTLAWAVANLTALIAQIPAGADGANLKVLVNWGVNEMATMPARATWVADYLTLIDAIVAKQPAAKVFCVKPWYQGKDSEALTMAEWVDEVVASRPSVAYLGHNEYVWLRGTDNGTTMTSDGVHYSTAGQAECASQWHDLITAQEVAPEYQQFVYPVADATDGNWVNASASNVNLYASLGESPVYDDATYAISGAAPSNDELLVTLGSMTAPLTGHAAISVRVKLG